MHLSTAREADTWTFVIGGQINSITEKTKQRKSKKNRFLNRKEEKARAISQTHTESLQRETVLEREREKETAGIFFRVISDPDGRSLRWPESGLLFGSGDSPVSRDGEFYGGTRHERHAHRSWLGHEHRNLWHMQPRPCVCAALDYNLFLFVYSDHGLNFSHILCSWCVWLSCICILKFVQIMRELRMVFEFDRTVNWIGMWEQNSRKLSG